jgi:hypothetical protein
MDMRLRIVFLVTLMLALVALPAAAQVGIMAGGIYSDASVEVDGSTVDTEYRTGFQAGASYATGGVFGVIAGGYYTEKGFGLANSSNHVRLSYIEVPVMGVVRLPFLERVIGPRVYGGINAGFEVSCSAEGFRVTTFCDETNKFDFGLKGGIGIQVLFLGLDFAYTYGLSDVAKENEVKVNNRAWSLALIIGVG